MTLPPEDDIFSTDDPFALFRRWFAEAQENELNDPNAMALATVDADGLPDVRMVLLKGHDERGFVFYTNSHSAKAGQLAGGMRAAARTSSAALVRLSHHAGADGILARPTLPPARTLGVFKVG
jgi:pyridoxine/pyridoxamine 5'-phosphate oxidase